MVCCTVTGRKVRRISSAPRRSHVAASRRRVDLPSKPEPGLLTAQWNRCQEGQPQVQNPPARRHQGSRRHSEGFLFWYVFVSEWFRFYIHHRKRSETKTYRNRNKYPKQSLDDHSWEEVGSDQCSAIPLFLLVPGYLCGADPCIVHNGASVFIFPHLASPDHCDRSPGFAMSVHLCSFRPIRSCPPQENPRSLPTTRHDAAGCRVRATRRRRNQL